MYPDQFITSHLFYSPLQLLTLYSVPISDLHRTVSDGENVSYFKHSGLLGPTLPAFSRVRCAFTLHSPHQRHSGVFDNSFCGLRVCTRHTDHFINAHITDASIRRHTQHITSASYFPRALSDVKNVRLIFGTQFYSL